MDCFVGIDLGTSSVRSIAFNEKGEMLAQGQCEYDIIKPELNQAEQDMEVLYQSTVDCMKQMLACDGASDLSIRGISFSGQMHGLVMLDQDNRPIRNAIIWADQRSEAEIEEIYQTVPLSKVSETFCNRLSTGFLLPSLIWVRDHEPENYEKIAKILSPKDYIRYRMCGELGTDASDASATGLLDMKSRTWAVSLLQKLDIPTSFLVPVHESYEQAGEITPGFSRETGVPAGTFVAYGGGDSLMMELGNGMIRSGIMASTIGTGCHLTCATTEPIFDPQLRTNSWCHASEHLWSIMGAHLSGGVALKWLKNDILGCESFDEMTDLGMQVPVGSEGLLFLPYLNGERTPYNDPNAKAIYLGMTLKHDKRYMIRSTMEGIVYSMKESFVIFRSLGIEPSQIIAAGGGAKSRLLLQIQADMYDCPIYTTKEHEQASLGAAITAAVGCGAFPDYEAACKEMVKYNEKITEPVPENVDFYEAEFPRFQELYKRNKPLF